MKRQTRGDKVPISIRLPEKVHKRLVEASIDQDVSMTALIVLSLNAYLKVKN